MQPGAAHPFLRIPPFPGARLAWLCRPAPGAAPQHSAGAIAAALREARVGGCFWGAQSDLPEGRTILLVPASADQARAMQTHAAARGDTDRSLLVGPFDAAPGIARVPAGCDPWHLASAAEAVFADADQDIVPVAVLLGVPVTLLGDGRWSKAGGSAEAAVVAIASGWEWLDPFSGQPTDILGVVAILRDWRRLIDANRGVAAITGVAAWKRITTDALLWDGGEGRDARYARRLGPLDPESRVLAWKSRTSAPVLAAVDASGARVGEIEDGFIRSTGLGANCVPPLSIIVDNSGIYFDPSGSSDLELLLAEAEIPTELQSRAAQLRSRLVSAGIAKYGRSTSPVAIARAGVRRVLVPGQVADDRSVLSGGSGGGNLALLAKARELEPYAWLIYKPHPDVLSGHRAGHIAEGHVMAFADEIDTSGAIAPLIDSVDAIHTLTSLAGFEGLMRGKSVTAHGMPFYAGWGLTRDLLPKPARRGRSRTLDELVAATLLLYPRYLDPVTRLPCPAEVLVTRLDDDKAVVTSPIVQLRELQGRAIRIKRRFVQFVRGNS